MTGQREDPSVVMTRLIPDSQFKDRLRFKNVIDANKGMQIQIFIHIHIQGT